MGVIIALGDKDGKDKPETRSQNDEPIPKPE
jgi:hypothetical protein